MHDNPNNNKLHNIKSFCYSLADSAKRGMSWAMQSIKTTTPIGVGFS